MVVELRADERECELSDGAKTDGKRTVEGPWSPAKALVARIEEEDKVKDGQPNDVLSELVNCRKLRERIEA